MAIHCSPMKWSFTMPTACMKAWQMVGPTKLNPRFRSSLLINAVSSDPNLALAKSVTVE